MTYKVYFYQGTNCLILEDSQGAQIDYRFISESDSDTVKHDFARQLALKHDAYPCIVQL